ncbi:MAG TPA: 6-phosphogluconolactonase [Elusimicrobiales bacterium]|nr:6-phosphogluconolactonase [Elusimicrobiales bacterium]
MALVFDKIYRFKNVDFLNRKAADYIGKLSNTVLRKRQRFTLALSGGSTPVDLYGLLSTKAYAGKFKKGKVHLFWVDERFVPNSDIANNFGMFCNAFKCKKNIPAKNIHAINTNFTTFTQSAKNYQAKLERFFGSENLPQFDLIILGIGADGHTASLFPRHKALLETKKWVSAVSIPKEEVSKRISLTLPVLNNAKNILFLVTGKSKRKILNKILNFKKPTPAFPVTLLNPKGKVYLFSDIKSFLLDPR